MSRQYSRVFISLKQDRTGYDFKGKEPSGRCVIEAKSGVSKLTVYIQDIKPEIMYKAYIISSKHSLSEGVQVGTLNIDAKGKAELKWEFDADNVCGTGKAIEEFNVFAVLISAKNELISPLVGYKDGITTWKNNFVAFSRDRKEREELKAVAEEAAAKTVEEEAKSESIKDEVRYETNAEEIIEAKAETVEAKDEIKAEEVGETQIEAEEAEDRTETEEIDEAEIETEEVEDRTEADETDEADIEAEEVGDEAIAEETGLEPETQEAAEDDSVPEQSPTDAVAIETVEKNYATVDEFFEPVSAKKEDFAELLNKELEEAEIMAEELNNTQADEDEPVELNVPAEPEPYESEVQTEEAAELLSEPEPSLAGESKPDIHATFLEMAKNFNRELRELEQITFVKPDDIESAGIAEADDTPEPGTLTGKDSVGIPVSDGIDEMFKNNPSMRPFQKQNIDVSWIRISMREIIFLPLDHWKYMNHSFFVSAYNRFRHLILGKYNENGEYKYFLGVPEIYDSVYKKTAMSLGFTQFKCCEDVRIINGEYGYWIMPLQS